jgi:ligand-binding sensor domain-containing protein/signal transduction histidine kinase
MGSEEGVVKPSHLFNRIILVLICLIMMGVPACQNQSIEQVQDEFPFIKNVDEPVMEVKTPYYQTLPHVQNNDIHFEHYSVDQGFSQSSIRKILQDHNGYLWFATQDGLNKYNGYAVTIYHHEYGNENSLAHNTINDLIEDRYGNIWVATEGGGVSKFDPKTNSFTQYQARPNSDNMISSDYTFALLEDENGAIWIGTSYGLNRLDPLTGENKVFIYDDEDPNSLSHNIVISLLQDRSGTLWVGTNKGLNRYDEETGSFKRYQYSSVERDTISGNRILSMCEDHFGDLWIGTGNGLNRFDPNLERFYHFQYHWKNPSGINDNLVYTVFQDSQYNLWVGTAEGLERFDWTTQSFTHYYHDPNQPNSLSTNDIRAISEDREGNLWIGTNGGGINKLSAGHKNFVHYHSDPLSESGLSSDMIWSIFEDRDGDLWIGTADGLNHYDLQSGTIEVFRNDPQDYLSLSHDLVRFIYKVQSGDLLIGTTPYVDIYNPETKTFSRMEIPGFGQQRLKTIIQSRDGAYWIGTENGLYFYDEENGETQLFVSRQNDQHSLTYNDVQVLFEDNHGFIWVGSIHGLNKYDREKDQFTRYFAHEDNPSGISDNLILCIYQDRSGVLWIGTFNGLNRYDPKTDTFRQYHNKDGLPNEVVYGILEDVNGFLWMSTNLGIAKFDPENEIFTSYTNKDGLQSNEFNSGAYFQGRYGVMYFGGINGFNAFYPESIKTNTVEPNISLTSMTQAGVTLDLSTPVDYAEEVVLKWPQNFFEFEFASLSFIQSDQNQYAYKLEGFENSWNYAGNQHNGRYTNLPGGSYTLRIIGSNNDGFWNTDGKAINIRVIPPFWQTELFVVGMILMGGLLIVGGYRIRVRSIAHRNAELSRMVDERTEELRIEVDQRLATEEALRQSEMEKAVAAERSRLARDLHDAVTQTLFSASLIAEALPDAIRSDPEETDFLLKELRQLSRGALAEMRTLLLELRPSALVEAKLGDLLNQLAEAAIGREGVPIIVKVFGQCKLDPDAHVAMYRIAQEALNNILKHARATEVLIQLNGEPVEGQSSQRVTLQVKDNGRGFDLDSIPPGRMGVGIMAERAEAIGAELRIDSEPGKGTLIVVVWQPKR